MDKIHAIILAGSLDFGRCKIASKVPVCLWPVFDKPAIIRIIEWFQNQGISSVTICLDGDYSILDNVISQYSFKISIDYLTETMPWGTAGCVREAIKLHSRFANYIVSKAAMLLPPSISGLLENHQSSKKLLTVAINPTNGHNQSFYEATGAYVFDKNILEFIPKLGYCDIKERLIPNLLQHDKKINAYLLEKKTGSYRDIESYFNAIVNSMSELINEYNSDDINILDDNVIIAKTAKIAKNVKIFGPTVIMDGASIDDKSVVFGPSIISSNSVINKSTFIEASIIWDQVEIGSYSQIKNCLINKNTKLLSKSIRNTEVIV